MNAEKQTCGACFAFPPNINDEAYCDFREFYCRASGLVVKADTSACGVFAVDPKQEGEFKEKGEGGADGNE